jgi:hypothetical protein
VTPELALVVAVTLAIAVRFLWRELLTALVICFLVIVFAGILYLVAATSPEVLQGT